MTDAVFDVRPLGFPWETVDPFLFCVHHDDAYPKGNDAMGPVGSLAGRDIGQDFAGIDGWRMYHGQLVPGFPRHPHRGFETVTVVRRGLVDHADSMGATARYGQGDTQWLTAGAGIVHAEMFPLVKSDAPNPLELFQIWLNLPGAKKMADPHFSMFWAPQIPTVKLEDPDGRAVSVTLVAGKLGDTRAPAPPPASWASHNGADVAIWTVALSPGARWKLPPTLPTTNRTLYFFSGKSLSVSGRDLTIRHSARVRADAALELVNGDAPAELLMLQGRPIGEPVAHYGPFVMNTQDELRQTFIDFRRTEFGGWPWPVDGPVHPKDAGRFARHVGGKTEHPGPESKRRP